MPDSATLTSTLFLTLVTTEPNGAGAIVRILARKNAQSFDKLARGQRLSMAQSRVAGVTNSALEDASDLDVVLQDLLEFAEGCDLWIAALGAPVRERLKEAAVSGGYPGILGPGVLGLDELSAAVLPTVGRRGLQDLCAHYGLASDAAAGGSAESFVAEPQLMEQLCARLLDDLEKLPLPLLSELNWMLSKTDHPLRKILKTAESHGVETQFVETFNSGKISFEKLFKDFSKLIDKLRPEDDERDVNVEHAPAAELLETGAVRRMMGADGPLSKLDGYEERPEQERMAERVARAFNEGKHLMIEAGTGVGKSLAYLLPSILYAKRSGRPVMLSTYTKNLQSQLYHTDIPFLKKHLGIEFDAALLRGRTNYLCLRKFMFTLHESAHELDDDERGKMLPVMTWAASTEHGDVSELAAFSPEQSPALWDRLHTVGEDCLKRACPFYKRCFVYKARALAKTADVVVLNHALVFSSLNALYPGFWNPAQIGNHAMIMIVIAYAWKFVSYNFIFFLAGLQSVPRGLIEAAAMDGAGVVRRMRDIQIPLLTPTIFFLLMINITDSFVDSFGIIDITTEGGPAKATNLMVYKIYFDGFKGLDYSGAAAQSIILMLLVMVLTIIQFRFVERKIHYK